MLRDVAVAGCVTFFDSTPGSEKDYRFIMTFGLFLLVVIILLFFMFLCKS